MTTVTNTMNPHVSSSLPFKVHRDFRRKYSQVIFQFEDLREGRVAFHVKEIMEYLELHDHPEKLRIAKCIEKMCKCPREVIKRRLRKALGETHWRRYLDYYNRYYRTGTRSKIDLTESHKATVPPLPMLTEALDADVTEMIFSFLDGKAMYEASKVSRAFRDAFIPRQRNVTTAGFSTMESFRSMNFLGAEYLSVDDKCKWLTSDTLPSILEYPSLPNLAQVDLYHHDKLSARCEANTALAMGLRLERILGAFSSIS